MSVIAPSAVGRDHRGPADFPGRLFRVEGCLTELITMGLFAEGLRMQRSFEGRIVSGQPAGALVCGVEEFIIRPDGTGVIDARQVISADDGPLTATVLGYSHPPAGLRMPPLEALLEPGFRWPDLACSIECAAIYHSTSPAFAGLGRTVVACLGQVNMATRELVIDGYPAALAGTASGGSPA
jgi:hypothetical protein